jgi:NADPH-dependent 2,4-dienoyl-CoA reductase/sulfur reductase-like enzyme
MRVSTDKGLVEADLVLMGTGITPEVSLAGEAGIALGPTGAISVNERMQTNVDFIYAAGDCCECLHRVSRRPVHFPLGDTANKQGRVAGSNIGGLEAVFPGIVGSYCLKIFGLEVAGTGMTMEDARDAGIEARSVTIDGESRAHSYPGGGSLKISLIADSGSGRLLGAQAVGGEGAVSRINALAAGLTSGINVETLAYLDFAYAPPFSGAWDPIHIAAQQILKQISQGRNRV